MKRQEVFQAVAGVVAASGVALRAETIEFGETAPALAVFECDHPLSREACARIAESWADGTNGTALHGTKAVVLDSGLHLTLLDARGHVLNRTLEDEPK